MICFPFLFYSGFVNGFLLKWSSIQLAFFFYLVFFSPRHKCMEGSFVIFGILAFFLVVCLFSSVEVSYSGNVVVVVLV